MTRFPDLSVAGLANAVAAYRDSAAEARRLAALPGAAEETHPFAAPIMQATLEGFAALMDRKANNLETKIAERAPVEGSA
jgi:hypothetical protein